MSSPANERFSQQDNVVVVMGPTGAGKSTFIDCATLQGGTTVGHGWKSQTSEVRSVRTTHPTDGHPVVFVDTPGFDDTFKSDTEVLTMIAEWLVKTYKSNVNLSTILYLHRISDNRMSGTAMKNLQLFSSLCGRKVMPKVVIVTTMWSLVPAEWGAKREDVLKQEVWQDMINNGCETKRFIDTYESAWDIVGSVTQKDSDLIVGSDAKKGRVHVRLAREMVDDHLGLSETQAGITLNKTLERLMQDQQDTTRKLQERLKNHQGNELVVQELRTQAADIEKKIEQTTIQLRQLKIPFMRKFMLRFKKTQD